MCCFIVPLAQAVATSVYRKCFTKKIADPQASALMHQIPALEKMLWGGSVMLIVDHVINGELTWMFPFFTALGEENGASIMLKEILTVGVPMSIVLTLVWATYALFQSRKEARA